MSAITWFTKLSRPAILGLEFLAPLADLLLRVWVSWVFLKSGVNKFQSWDTTVLLFEYEYQVPLLSPDVAAAAGTGVELIFPVLLMIGLAGRWAALVLFVFNIMAVVSYPSLELPGKLDHLLWGIMLLMPVLRGPGKLSPDHFLRRKFIG
jgi:putative oxidoreductase